MSNVKVLLHIDCSYYSKFWSNIVSKTGKKSYFAQELTGHLHLLILYPVMCLLILYHAALNLISMSPVVRMLSPKALVCRWFQPKISWVYLQYKNSWVWVLYSSFISLFVPSYLPLMFKNFLDYVLGIRTSVIRKGLRVLPHPIFWQSSLLVPVV